MNTYAEFIQWVALFAGLVTFAWLLSKWQVRLVLLIAFILLVGLVYLNAPPPHHDSLKQRMELSAVSLYEQIKPSLCSNPEALSDFCVGFNQGLRRGWFVEL